MCVMKNVLTAFIFNDKKACDIYILVPHKEKTDNFYEFIPTAVVLPHVA